MYTAKSAKYVVPFCSWSCLLGKEKQLEPRTAIISSYSHAISSGKKGCSYDVAGSFAKHLLLCNGLKHKVIPREACCLEIATM
jgi:hypothetical protein